MLNNIIKKPSLILIATSLLSSSLSAKDANVLAYIERGIKYYPRYVQEGFTKVGKASWYGKPFHQRLTASGERYNMYNMTAAHRTYALNTVLKVTNLDNKKAVKVRVNDRGPFYHSRDIDLSYGAAQKIGIIHKGISRVKIEVLSSPKKVASTKTASKTTPKKVTKAIERNQKVQIASFSTQQSAQAFKAKHNIKHMMILKKYLPEEKQTSYRVIVKCTPWEAQHLIKSQKFQGAFLVS